MWACVWGGRGGRLPSWESASSQVRTSVVLYLLEDPVISCQHVSSSLVTPGCLCVAKTVHGTESEPPLVMTLNNQQAVISTHPKIASSPTLFVWGPNTLSHARHDGTRRLLTCRCTLARAPRGTRQKHKVKPNTHRRAGWERTMPIYIYTSGASTIERHKTNTSHNHACHSPHLAHNNGLKVVKNNVLKNQTGYNSPLFDGKDSQMEKGEY
ncbi:hypothetical protein B0I72DRAFT_156965 [Yarrowia lipolytica]|nr:hypothetical protein B0I72DRAFT_156965 [Yarrowia lipolytica]RDW43742.1 hypothetical protein B0I74DRAFT_160417 [Yarrowia lipolytica]